ncbi:hypothetical protein BOTBODRAFT_185577 [Botryobasidium botryosum FD-172 SS1]|uniref:Uncharacterized protein n=1 Tax=Botryobasidium botryosum (strain FD-172 SS1) TaxID=930990 RepID=A0A067MR56_BOTB1|nr:hypothetical protein BOTBODRAFT_185577 [Botryobasidium botryosum FD-172 SS1]
MLAFQRIVVMSLLFISSLFAFALAAPAKGRPKSYSGEATHYDPALGACGKVNKGTDHVVAVSKLIQSHSTIPGHTANPNQNPLCGRKIKASYGKKSVTVTLVDRCETCQYYDLDFSPSAFEVFAPLGSGRLTKGMTWEWA